MTNPLFSILCATKNCSSYIDDAIKSVLNQDYQNWELLILDDCSKDNTFEIVSSYSDSRIIKNRNETRLKCGLTYAKLLSMANGEYCGVLDGDDMLKYNAISTIVDAYAQNPNIDFIWTKHRWCNGSMTRDKPGISSSPKKRTIYESEDGFRHVYSHWRTFKTRLKDRAELFKDMPCTVDKELGYTLEEIGYGGFLPLELYLYRYHQNNMSHNSNQKEAWARVRKKHADRKRFGVSVL